MVKNILLIGNSARAHAIAEAVKRSPQKPRLHSFMSARNPGIIDISESIMVGELTDCDAIVQFAKQVTADFAVIGPEASLGAGVVDALQEKGIQSVGPTKKCAQLETSKSFTRRIIEKYNIPGNPQFKVFMSTQGIREFMNQLGEYVVKADGLHGGKGVKLSGEHFASIEDGVAYCKECIERDGKVVVEEKFVGQEFSLMSFCDGKTIADMPPVQDHKRAFEHDSGPNTGGMGSYTSQLLLPFLIREDLAEAHLITQKICDAMREECGEQYKGVLYGGFIATKNGVRVIEYNVRFGDPEAMNVLPLLTTDFVEVCDAIINGTLGQLTLEFEQNATVCKYVVPAGYPSDPVKGELITINGNVEARMYYASVNQKEDGLHMTASRAIAFVGIADTLHEAEQQAERAVQAVQGNVFHRKDIGTKELVQARVDHMMRLRKEKMRAGGRDVRTHVPRKEEKSRLICEKLKQLAEFKNAEMIAFYVSTPDEVCTHGIIKEFLQQKKISVPVCHGDSLTLSTLKRWEELTSNKQNILEPENPHHVNLNEVDLIITPGIFFDEKGNRLGQGKGYYDRLLKYTSCTSIALAFDAQIQDGVLTEQHDQKVNKIITEKRIIDCDN